MRLTMLAVMSALVVAGCESHPGGDAFGFGGSAQGRSVRIMLPPDHIGLHRTTEVDGQRESRSLRLRLGQGTWDYSLWLNECDSMWIRGTFGVVEREEVEARIPIGVVQGLQASSPFPPSDACEQAQYLMNSGEAFFCIVEDAITDPAQRATLAYLKAMHAEKDEAAQEALAAQMADGGPPPPYDAGAGAYPAMPQRPAHCYE